MKNYTYDLNVISAMNESVYAPTEPKIVETPEDVVVDVKTSPQDTDRYLDEIITSFPQDLTGTGLIEWEEIPSKYSRGSVTDAPEAFAEPRSVECTTDLTIDDVYLDDNKIMVQYSVDNTAVDVGDEDVNIDAEDIVDECVKYGIDGLPKTIKTPAGVYVLSGVGSTDDQVLFSYQVK